MVALHEFGFRAFEVNIHVIQYSRSLRHCVAGLSNARASRAVSVSTGALHNSQINT